VRSDFAVGFIREYGDSFREQKSKDNFFFRRVFRGTGMDYAFYPGAEGAMSMQALKRLVGNQSDTVYFCPVDAANEAVGGASGSSRSYLMLAERFRKGQNDDEVAFIGGTSWIGIDHNRSYAPDISACGLWDLLRLPKFSCYAMMSQRATEKNDILTEKGLDNGPMVFIASYWTEKAPVMDKTNEAFTTWGTDTERIIIVYSNAKTVKLSVVSEEGRGLYEKVASPKGGNNRELINAPFEFLGVPYFEGSHLVAVGYDASGNAVAHHEVYTSLTPDHIELAADTMGISPVADGSDTVMLYAYIKDKNGTVCHNSYNTITFSVISGDATIVGDGIPRVKSNPVNAEAGVFGVYVKMGIAAGDIIIRADADGIKAAELILTSTVFTAPASPYFLIPYTEDSKDACRSKEPTDPLVTKRIAGDDSRSLQCVSISKDLDRTYESDKYKNIAFGKPTEASSVLSGSSSSFAVDGSESSVWIGNLVGEGEDASPEYLIVDLEKITNLCGVRVGLLNDSITYRYQIQVSEDKTNWKTVAAVAKTGQESGVLDAFKASYVRYVKILFTEIESDIERGQYSNATVTEIEIYEDRDINFAM
jgi:hypothetical protein